MTGDPQAEDASRVEASLRQPEMERELQHLRDQVKALATANAHAAELMAELHEARELEETLKANNALLEEARTFERERSQFLELIANNSGLPVLLEKLAGLVEARTPHLAVALLVFDGPAVQHMELRNIGEDLSSRLQRLSMDTVESLTGAIGRRKSSVMDLLYPAIQDPCWTAALQSGFARVGCFPAKLSDGRIPGLMLVFYRTEQEAPSGESDLLEQVAQLLRTALNNRILTQQLTHQARHDALTGLPNRNTYYEALQSGIASLRPGRKLAVLWADLDRFKQINDTLGHRVGDLLLQMAAERMRSCLRADSMAARMGGDEFVILLNDLANVDDAESVARRLVSAFNEPFVFGEHRVGMQMSVGVSVYPDHAEDAETLVRNADLAMYGAKHCGRGTYLCFTPERESVVRERFKIETYLRRALELGELDIYYQPLTSCKDGTIQSLEALLRWYSPDLGCVPPGEFIPVAENSGLMIPIGRWVLDQACGHLREFQGGNLPIRIAVNVSATQLSPGNFPEVVKQTIEAHGIPPGQLKLELTESCILGASEYRSQILELRELGVSLSIDDFGTGYSSLSYLHTLPVDELKMDRSFVAGMEKDASSARLVEAIVVMAKALDLRVVAEGVETAKQMDRLRQLGCDLLQGYYIHKPMPFSRVKDLLLSQLTGIEEPALAS